MKTESSATQRRTPAHAWRLGVRRWGQGKVAALASAARGSSDNSNHPFTQRIADRSGDSFIRANSTHRTRGQGCPRSRAPRFIAACQNLAPCLSKWVGGCRAATKRARVPRATHDERSCGERCPRLGCAAERGAIPRSARNSTNNGDMHCKTWTPVTTLNLNSSKPNKPSRKNSTYETLALSHRTPSRSPLAHLAALALAAAPVLDHVVLRKPISPLRSKATARRSPATMVPAEPWSSLTGSEDGR